MNSLEWAMHQVFADWPAVASIGDLEDSVIVTMPLDGRGVGRVRYTPHHLKACRIKEYPTYISSPRAHTWPIIRLDDFEPNDGHTRYIVERNSAWRIIVSPRLTKQTT
jgi:hypothetical protein